MPCCPGAKDRRSLVQVKHLEVVCRMCGDTSEGCKGLGGIIGIGSLWVFPKIGGFSTQIIHFNRVLPYKPSILGYPYFLKHPYEDANK